MLTAYRTVMFWILARIGQLKDWAVYRAQWFGQPATPTTAPPEDWRARKERRRQQMTQFTKQQQRRNAPPPRRRG